MGGSTKAGQKAFRLEDLSAQWAPLKLWRVVFDVPGEKVNKLSSSIVEDFESVMTELERLAGEGKVDAVALVSGKPDQFVAGADIEMLQRTQTAAEAEALSGMGQAAFNRWEDLPVPTVAIVDGPALGGGCELALASTAIVMSDNPAGRIGLPEVMLGVIPGTGGCVRLPARLGVAEALKTILGGGALNGERAYRAGLVDALLPRQNFEESALAWIRKNLEALKRGERLGKEPKLGGQGGTIGALMEKTPVGRMAIFHKAHSDLMKKTRGNYPAQLEAFEVIRSSGATYGRKLKGSAREKALLRERQGFGRCVATDVSKNLIRLFFLTEGVKKSKGLPPGVEAKPHAVQSAAVLGAGVMGGGIAQLFADKGIPIRMKDLSPAALALGVQQATKIWSKDVKKRKLSPRQAQQKLNLIGPTLDYSGFHAADAVVEAIIEKMDVKKKVLAEVEGSVKDDCVLATNTSSLSVSEMQGALKHPERFVGMHFFNPVAKMLLVEVIRGNQSSDEAVSTIFQLSKRLGKTPIVVKDAPGFLVNRLLVPYMNEAIYVLADGAPIPEIDQAMLDFGMPMGPMELIDEVGIDVGEKVLHILHDAFGARMVPAPLNAKVLESGRLGKKNGKGLYDYEGKERRKVLDPKIYETMGVTPAPGAVAPEEIVERCVLPMINEAARCLEEGVVASPSEVDLGMIMGTGFPPFRGGLLRYADTLGPQAIVDRLRKYQERFGARYEPSPAMVARAKHDQKFYPSGT